ncbi:Adenylate kinase 7 [Sparganum proliferum]
MNSVVIRRSLNTTPTSPPGDFTDDEEGEIQDKLDSTSKSKMKQHVRRGNLSQEIAPTSRQPSPKDDQQGSRGTFPARLTALPQVGLRTVIVVVILICGSILVTLSVCSWADKRPNTNWRQAIRDLELSYPGQNSRLWTAIRSVMQTLSPEDHPFAVGPLVILLLPNSPSAKAADQQSLLPTKFTDFVQNLSQVLAQLNSAGSKDCVALNFSDLTSHHFRPHDATRQPTMKKLLLGKLQSEYDRNFRCFHIPGLDLLPGDVVLGLHGVSDYHSSPFKSSILIFSLSKSPPCEWPNDFRKMETCVRRLFHTLWDHSLGEEEVAALISRFTGRLAVFT